MKSSLTDQPTPPLKRKAIAPPLPSAADARARLLLAGLTLFAERGYAKTSTRQIAAAAQANIGAISYYFGDKQGLYRAAFMEAAGNPRDDIARFNDPAQPLHSALIGIFTGFTEPLRHGELMRLCTRLHMRELVEPSGMWADEIDGGMKLHHAAVVIVLVRHFKLKNDDDDLHRLAFAIISMGVFLFVGRDVMEQVRPSLFAKASAPEEWLERLVLYAQALVSAEELRRRVSPARQSPTSRPALGKPTKVKP